MFPGPLGHALSGKALKKNLWSLDIINIRDFGLTRHYNVDHPPYGGGNGMVMRPDVLGCALDVALKRHPGSKILYPSPRGILFNQQITKDLSMMNNIIILCGRFKGIDERIIHEYDVQQISMGRYILSGGEIAAMVILDSIIRLLPGVIKNQNAVREGSFEVMLKNVKLIEHPLYTKPQIWRGKSVPKVLLSGNHNKIKQWKTYHSIQVTKPKK